MNVENCFLVNDCDKFTYLWSTLYKEATIILISLRGSVIDILNNQFYANLKYYN